MIDNEEPDFCYPLPEQIKGKILFYSAKPLSSVSGIIRFLKRPGDLIIKDQKVARIYNAFGKLMETIVIENDGILIGLADNAIAFPGSPVMASGIYN